MTDEQDSRYITSMSEWYEAVFEMDTDPHEPDSQESSATDTAASLARQSLERLTRGSS